MPDPLKAASVLRAYGLSPKKKLGQNFIVSKTALEQVLSAAELSDGSQILEIGAGLGALTLELARIGRRILAVEYDYRLIPVLEDVLANHTNVELIHADFMQLDLETLLEPPTYSIVANIPYQITSAVIRKVVESPFPAEQIILTIQREVAERIIASPGELSLLALSVQIFGVPTIHSHIPPEAFYPQPKVDSSVIKIEMDPQPKIPIKDLDRFFRIAKAGFSQRRKKLRNALAAGLQLSAEEVEDHLQRADIEPGLRAQALALEQWIQLSDTFKDLA